LNKELLIFIIGFILIILIAIASFTVSFYLKKRRAEKKKRLYCEIYLKRGGRKTIIKSIDDDLFRITKNGISKTYIIVKEAIQDELIDRLTGPVLNHFINFEEGIANPFVMGFIGEDTVKKYVGAEKIDQMLNTHIWEQVGGINKSGLPTQMIVWIVLAIGIGFIAFVFLKK